MTIQITSRSFQSSVGGALIGPLADCGLSRTKLIHHFFTSLVKRATVRWKLFNR